MRQDPTAKRIARIEGEAARTLARRSNEQTPGRGPGEKRRRPGSISSAQVLTPPLAPTCRARKWDSQVTAGPPWAWLWALGAGGDEMHPLPTPPHAPGSGTASPLL